MSAYSDRIISDGAVAYWRLGETSGTTAVDVIGGNNGTISGGVTLGQPGALADGNTAMAFDGTNTGKIVTSQSVTIPVVCTLEAWVEAIEANRPIFSLTGEAPLFSLTALKALQVYDGASFSGLTSLGTLSEMRWYHIAYVLDGSTVTFYIDGVLDRTIAGVRGTPQTNIAGIGYDGAFAVGDLRNHWYGRLDEVAIYPTALTAPQIAAHYNLRTANGGVNPPGFAAINPTTAFSELVLW